MTDDRPRVMLNDLLEESPDPMGDAKRYGEILSNLIVEKDLGGVLPAEDEVLTLKLRYEREGERWTAIAYAESLNHFPEIVAHGDTKQQAAAVLQEYIAKLQTAATMSRDRDRVLDRMSQARKDKR